jgi:signal peptidase
MNEMKLKQALQIQALVLLTIMLTLLLLAVGPRFLGFSSFIVYSGSMEPAIKKGAIAIGKPVPPDDLEVGDIVAFKTATAEAPTVHRIVGIERSNGLYIVTTKGDANETDDPDPIIVRQYGSKIVYTLPYVGYVLEAPRAFLGPRLTFVLPTMILGLIVLWEIWSPLVLKSRGRRSTTPDAGPEGLTPAQGAG